MEAATRWCSRGRLKAAFLWLVGDALDDKGIEPVHLHNDSG